MSEILELWSAGAELRELIFETLPREVSDYCKIFDQVIYKIIGGLFFLIVLIPTMELVLPINVNHYAVPEVALSILVISAWYAFTKLGPLRTAIALTGPALIDGKPSGALARIAHVWREVRNTIIGFYFFEVIYCIVAYLLFEAFPVEHHYPALSLFFILVLVWIGLMLFGASPNNTLMKMGFIAVIVGCLVFAVIHERDPKGFQMGCNGDMQTFGSTTATTAELPLIRLKDLPDGGYCSDTLVPTAWGKKINVLMDNDPNKYIAITHRGTGRSRGMIIRGSDPERNEKIREALEAAWKKDPKGFFVQGNATLVLSPYSLNQQKASLNP